MSAWENNEEIKLFREYLRIPSVHPNIDYGKDIKICWTDQLNFSRDKRIIHCHKSVNLSGIKFSKIKIK